MAAVIVTALRLLIPFTILRWALLGGILAMLADAVDRMIFEAFGFGYLSYDYHVFDKFFDIYYLFFEFLVARKWTNKLARRTGMALFIWRFTGFTLFEITKLRWFFFLAPNIFEHFYLFWAAILRFFPKFKLESKKRLAVILLILGAPKMVQEYIMHYLEFGTWNFIRDNFFWWLYR